MELTTTHIFIISWFAGLALLYLIPKLFNKKWTFKEVREKVKFSKTIWLNNYADANGWDKNYIRKSWWLRFKEQSEQLKRRIKGIKDLDDSINKIQ